MTGIEGLIRDFGYLAVFIGTLLEGETTLVLAGLAAERGLLGLPWVIVVGIAGSITGNGLLFWLGRRHGTAWLERHPKWRERVARTHGTLERHSAPFLIVVRFLYGLRAVVAFVYGLGTLPYRRYLFYDALGAIAWSAAFSALGYSLGRAAGSVLGEIKHLEILLAAVVLLGAGVVWLISRRREKAVAPVEPSTPPNPMGS